MTYSGGNPKLMELGLPSHQLGYVSPLAVVDALHYEFYQTFGKQAVFVACPLPVSDFSAHSVGEALHAIPETVDYLRRREVDRIAFGGMPVSAFAGRPRMLDLMGEMNRTSGIPVTSDVEDIIVCLLALGIKQVALAAKWKPDVLKAAEEYFRAAGFEVLGTVGADFDVKAVSEIVTPRSADLAVELGQLAFDKYPHAQALILGGGTWLSVPASQLIERHSGKPVISNTTAMFIEAARQFKLSLDGWENLMAVR